MNNALDELFTKLGFDRRMLWRVSAIFWAIYVGSCVLAIYMPKAFIVAGLYLYMMFIALPIMFAPAFWVIAGTVFAIMGQFGREKGLSLRDAVDAVKEYGTPILDKVGYALLLALPIWFMAMVFINTKDIELWFLLGLPFLPTLIYLVIRRWPDGKTFEAVVRSILLAMMFGILAMGVYNTINRAVTDPSVQEVQTYLNEKARDLQKDEKEMAQLLINKVRKTGEDSLTPAQLGEWENLKKRAVEQTPAGRVTTIATQVATDVAQAKPSDPNWWKTHWYLPAGAIAIIVLVLWWFGRTPGTAGATPADAGAHASAGTATNPRTKWLWRLVIISGVIWCGYSIYTEKGWPGEYIANYGYTHQTRVYLKDLKDQKVCDPGLKPGTWHVSFPHEIARVHYTQNGRYHKMAGFYILHRGEMLHKSFLEDVWVNGIRTGWNEQVTIGPDQCFTVTVNISPEVKAEAVMYGNPQCWDASNQQSCQSSGTPRTAEVNLMFSKKEPIRP